MNEFPHIVKLRQIKHEPLVLEANAEQRAALAERFNISAVENLSAKVSLTVQGHIATATGRIIADVIQQCGVSGEDFPVHINEPLSVRFVPTSQVPDADEVELEEEDLDDTFYEGDSFDLGEAVAQSLGLAIDPFARGPNADATRKEAGLLDKSTAGPFAALAALKKQ